ncbi:MAG: NAD-dependent epimerase/dehydratase family protein [Acholeplasmataceae bacterium]|jgi:dihydroflavonol-4-reductase|nr:NAD-dependent epimerase/dehydratase family protein [Acholeplasmataceae bacterium]
MNRIYLVTGANGHLGYNLVARLRSQAKHVRGLILPSDSPKRLEALGCHVFFGDVTQPETLEPFFDLSDTNYVDHEVVCVHTAGIVSITNKKNPLIEKVNVGGTKNLISIAMKHHIHRFIYVSSVHAIQESDHNEVISETDIFDPNRVIGAYAKSKASASKLVLEAISQGLNGIVVHPSGIIGPDDIGHGHLTIMIEDYLNGKLTSRVKGAYDFVDVRDVAQGIIQAIEWGQIGSCYILSGSRIDLSELFEHLRNFSGKKRRIHVLPMWFAKLAIPFAEVYYRLRKLPPIYSKYSLYTLSSNSFFSHEKARLELHYQIRPIEDTIYDTLRWLADQNRVKRISIKSFIQGLRPMKKKSG